MSPAKEQIRKPIDIYVRVSQVGGRDVEAEGMTAEAQESASRSYLAAKDLPVGEVFKDIDVSGGKMSRAGFDKAIQRIHDGISGGIIVRDLKRFGRRTKAADLIIELEQTYGAVVIALNQDFDTSTPMGRAFVRIIAVLAELELEESTEVWKRSRAGALDRNVYLGKTPFGYEKSVIGYHPNGKAIPGPLVADKATAGYLLGIFQRRATGWTWTQIAEWLNEEGVEKRYSTTHWTQTDVAKIAANEVYIGVATDGDRRIENAHEALVPLDLWYGVKAIRESHRAEKKPSKQDAPIGGGYVRCGLCGVGLTRTTSTDRGGKKYGFYICRNPKCRKSSISAMVLEPFVYQRISEVALLKFEEPVNTSAERDERLAAVETAELAIQGFDATWADQGLDPSAAISMRKALEVKLEDARTALAALPVDVVDWRSKVRKYAEDWNKFFGSDVIDADAAVAEVEVQYTHGISGAAIVELLVEGGETAREVVRQNLVSVTVTGKSGAKAGTSESRGSVEKRVDVALR
jgi:site-specific DNA recombinase